MKRVLTTYILIMAFNHLLIAQNAVKTHEGVSIGGVKQWIGAISDDDSKPLLLFLHGGPGFSSRTYSKKFIKYLKRDFIIAQWDQRGTGITVAWNPSNDSVSLDMMHSDTEEVVDYLLKKFNKDKLYLVGFSWGGFLGLHYASQHPEKLHGYISVSGLISGNVSESMTLNLIRQRAKDENNPKANEELSEVTIPFTSWEQLYYQRKWTAYYSGGASTKKTYPKKLFENWSSQWMPIFLAACAIDYPSIVQELRCPVYFFLSRKDLVANYTLSEKYFNDLKADQKQLVWFEESTHEIPSEEPKKFSEELIKIVAAEAN